MKLLAFILNLPWTFSGIIIGVLSIPEKISFHRKPFAFIFHVKSFWWHTLISGRKGIRGMAEGNVILLGSNALPGDLEHELVHVEQSECWPLIQPFRYILESMRHGYRNNRFEREAYEKAGNRYITKEERIAIELAKKSL